MCLAKAMEKNSTVRDFNMSHNPIGSDGAVAFASMLKKNQSQRRLDLHDDSVGDQGTLELIESLKHNTTLEQLVLSHKYKPVVCISVRVVLSFATLDKRLQDCITFSLL